MNFNQSHDPSDALGEEHRLVSDVLSQSVIYSKIVQHRLLLMIVTIVIMRNSVMMMVMMTNNNNGDNNNSDNSDDKEMIIQVTINYLALSLAYHNHYHYYYHHYHHHHDYHNHCDDRAFDDLASNLQQMKTTVGAEELDE